jgi:hypothetical protein
VVILLVVTRRIVVLCHSAQGRGPPPDRPLLPHRVETRAGREVPAAGAVGVRARAIAGPSL